MKKIILLCVIFTLSSSLYSQETYSVNGETLELKTEVDGKLDLLWNVIDGKYRYFVRTENGTITELKNTKSPEGNYNEDYKTTLYQLTNGQSTKNLKLTLYSLKDFFDSYNTLVDDSYSSIQSDKKLGLRFGFSGGITNNPFVGNPDNTFAPLIGVELELYDANNESRHSGFLQGRHAFSTDDFNYATTEFSLGYRFRFIHQDTFSLYGQTKFATVNFTDVTFIDANAMEADINETAFDLPFIFGIGTDIKISDNSYITFIYSELFAVFFDNQGNFPVDFSLGYKFNL